MAPGAGGLSDPAQPFSAADITAGAAVFALLVAGTWWLFRSSVDRRLITLAVALKLLTGILYCVYVVYIYGGGDALLYHAEGIREAAVIRATWSRDPLAVLNEPSCLGVTPSPTAALCHVSGALHVLLWDSFLATSQAVALVGLAGQWLLYLTFRAAYPQAALRRWWALGLIFFPSMFFWTAGMTKDPFRIAALAAVLWGVQRLLDGASLGGAAGLAVGALGLLVFRPEITLVVLVAVVPWIWLSTRRRASRDGVSAAVARRRRWSALSAVSVVALVSLVQRQTPAAVWIGAAPAAIAAQEQAFRSVEATVTAIAPTPTPRAVDGAVGAAAPVGRLAPRTPLFVVAAPPEAQAPPRVMRLMSNPWVRLAVGAPEAVVTTLFRPWPWEVEGVTDALAAIENVGLLAIVVVVALGCARRPHAAIAALGAPLFVTSALLFALGAVAVGASTPNLGSVSRYRVTVTPFLSAILVIFYVHTGPLQLMPLRKKLE